jgi:hypothetical protein
MLRTALTRGVARSSLAVGALPMVVSVPSRAAVTTKAKKVYTGDAPARELDGAIVKRMKVMIDDIFNAVPKTKQVLTMSPEQRIADRAFVGYALRKLAMRKARTLKLEQRKINVKNATFGAIPAELREHCMTVDTEPWPVALLTPSLTPPARDWMLHYYRLLDISHDELYRRMQEALKQREEARKQAKLERRRERALKKLAEQQAVAQGSA